jgi:hypothetical protein
MAGITNDFECVKVRVLWSVCWSQGRDTIEFGFDKEPKFNHQAAVSFTKAELVALRKSSPIGAIFMRGIAESRGKKKRGDSAHARACRFVH